MIRMILFFPLWLLSMAAFAAPIPEREYHEICQNCRMDESGILVCECPDGSGGSAEQTLDMTACEDGTVEFRSGYLFCNKATQEDEIVENLTTDNSVKKNPGKPNYPTGDYWNYCSSCEIQYERQGNGIWPKLSCECKDPSSELPIRTSMNPKVGLNEWCWMLDSKLLRIH